MPREPLRFIHAANLSIDHSLAAGSFLPEAVGKTVENAAVIALRNVVTACVDRNVDFLLLAGETFDERRQCLSTRLALVDQLNRLAESNVRVFIMAGQSDPPSSWRSIIDLPDNVTVFARSDEQPVAVLRDGKVIATICRDAAPKRGGNGRPRKEHSPSDSARRTPYTIVLRSPAGCHDITQPPTISTHERRFASCESAEEESMLSELKESGIDYLALGGRDVRRTVTTPNGLAHHPGSTQGLDPLATGPHGCTLVDVEAEGAVHCTFLPTAPVRWERQEMMVEPQLEAERLIHAICDRLREYRPEPNEQMWLVQLTLTGFGRLFDSLFDEHAHQQFLDGLNRQAANAVGLQTNHYLRLLPAADAVSTVAGKSALFGEYFTSIERGEPFGPATLGQYLESAAIGDEAWSERLQSLIGDLDSEVIAGHARQLGVRWFGAQWD